MEDGQFFPALYPWDSMGQQRTHNVGLVNGYLTPVPQSQVALNQKAQIETDLYSGHEGWDYQNPNSWVAASVLPIATLVPDYPIQADTPQTIARNISTHQGELLK